MAYTIVVKKRFTNKFSEVLIFLEEKWSLKVANDFQKKTEHRFILLSKQPYIGALSQRIPDVRGVLITRHNKMYYKVKGNKTRRERQVGSGEKKTVNKKTGPQDSFQAKLMEVKKKFDN